MKKQSSLSKRSNPTTLREWIAHATTADGGFEAETLLHREERLRFSLEAANVGTWEWNISSGEVRWSDNMERIHGQAPGSFGGTFEGFLQGVHRDDRDNVLKAIKNTLEGGASYEIEYRQIAADRTVRWMEGKGQVLCDETGRPLRMMGICMDISVRKRAQQALESAYTDAERQIKLRTARLKAANEALQIVIAGRERSEAALRESEQRLHAILESSPSIIFLKDTEGRYLYANPEFQKLWNLTQGQIVGKTDSEIFLPEQAQAFRANDLKVLETQAPLEFDEVALQDDGLHTSIVTKFPLRDTKGRVYAICGMVTDITARKRAEAELNRRNSRLVALIENSPLGIVVMDPEGRIEMCNSAFERLFLYGADEIRGLPLLQLIATPEMQAEWIQEAPRFMKGEIVHRKTLRRRKDGVSLEVEIYAVPLMENGTFCGGYGLYQDVTERNRFEEALRTSQESLRELSARLLRSQDEERRRVARDLHDDFNQKLAMLSVEAESLYLDHPRLARAVRERLLALQEHVIQLSDDVRRTAYKLHPSSLEHLGLVASLESLCTDFAAQESMRLHFHHRNVRESIPQDVALCLYRIAQEALQNVGRHARARAVEVALNGTGAGLRLSIDDDGVGFECGAETCKPGLGITSMEERARLVGGKTTVTSRPGGGTRIDVWIPAAPGKAKRTASGGSPP